MIFANGLEDIPLVKDAIPNFVALGSFAMLGPKGMPADLAAKFNRDLNGVLGQPEVVVKMRDFSMFPSPRSQVDSATFLKTEVNRWAAVIRKVRLEPQ
ncbi:MAG: tripartite tricarboxylate transporter substrate-binding protein [Rhodoferax sp.]